MSGPTGGLVAGNPIVGSISGSVPNTGGSLMIMEEHAVMPEPTFSSTVTIYDALGLLPVLKELAGQYKSFFFILIENLSY